MSRTKGSKNKSKQQEQSTPSSSLISAVNNDTFLVTSQKYEQSLLEEAIEKQRLNNFKSTYLNEKSSMVNFSVADIDNLSLNAQTDLNKIIKINSIVRYFVNKNDILGKVYEAIETNVNPKWELDFGNIDQDDESEKEIYQEVKSLIEDFNRKIKLENLIVDSIPMSYLEGNYHIYLRKDVKTNSYQVDYYPLGVLEVSDYDENGEPYLLVNIQELKSRLQKIYKKNKKNQPLFYKTMDDEVKDTFPKEVYDAFVNNEQYAKLDIKNSGVIRINNMRRKYGLSPIFKALKPAIRLENIELSDDKNTLVRGKKIIFQKLSKELILKSTDSVVTWSSAQAKAHTDLMAALGNEGVSVYTGLPWTESVQFVEPQMEQTNVQTKNMYKNEIMTTIGISYLSADKGSFGAATISIKELMKLINRISSQLEKILYKWYQGILEDNGFDPEYAPTIKIIDSEQLENDIKLKLVEVLFNKLNGSYETAYKLLGINAKDEFRRRKYEQEKGYEEVFKPHPTSYTSSGNIDDDEGGRPKDSKDKQRQEYDDDYNNQSR